MTRAEALRLLRDGHDHNCPGCGCRWRCVNLVTLSLCPSTNLCHQCREETPR